MRDDPPRLAGARKRYFNQSHWIPPFIFCPQPPTASERAPSGIEPSAPMVGSGTVEGTNLELVGQLRQWLGETRWLTFSQNSLDSLEKRRRLSNRSAIYPRSLETPRRSQDDVEGAAGLTDGEEKFPTVAEEDSAVFTAGPSTELPERGPEAMELPSPSDLEIGDSGSPGGLVLGAQPPSVSEAAEVESAGEVAIGRQEADARDIAELEASLGLPPLPDELCLDEDGSEKAAVAIGEVEPAEFEAALVAEMEAVAVSGAEGTTEDLTVEDVFDESLAEVADEDNVDGRALGIATEEGDLLLDSLLNMEAGGGAALGTLGFPEEEAVWGEPAGVDAEPPISLGDGGVTHPSTAVSMEMGPEEMIAGEPGEAGVEMIHPLPEPESEAIPLDQLLMAARHQAAIEPEIREPRAEWIGAEEQPAAETLALAQADVSAALQGLRAPGPGGGAGVGMAEEAMADEQAGTLAAGMIGTFGESVLWGEFTDGRAAEVEGPYRIEESQAEREQLLRQLLGEIGDVLPLGEVPVATLARFGARKEQLGLLQPTTDLLPRGKLDFPEDDRVIEADVAASAAVERALSIFRHTVSVPAGPSGEREITVEALMTHQSELLHAWTADLNEISPADVTPSPGGRRELSFARDVELTVRLLVPKRLAQAGASPRHEGARRGSASTLSRQLQRQTAEEKLRNYALWRAWVEAISLGRRRAAGEAEAGDEMRRHHDWRLLAGTTIPPDVARWLGANVALADPIAHWRALGMTQADAFTEASLQWLGGGYDRLHTEMTPYRSVEPTTLPTELAEGAETAYMLLHSPVAWQFFSLPVRPSLVWFSRFARPDFRTGFFQAHCHARGEKVPAPGRPIANQLSSAVALSRPPETTLTKALKASAAAARPRGSGQDYYGAGTSRRSSVVGSEDTAKKLLLAAQDTTTASLFEGAWRVQAPRPSSVLETCRSRATSTGDFQRGQSTELMASTRLLSISEWTPIVIIEHAYPPAVIASLGMGARIQRFYRNPREVMAPAQVERKLRGRLGFFGMLDILGDRSLHFFGAPYRVKPNAGVAFFQSTVIRGPCFCQPHDVQRRPLATPEEYQQQVDAAAAARANLPNHSARQGWAGLNHTGDFRLTDFLLIRSHCIMGSHRSRVTLRPLYSAPAPAVIVPPSEMGPPPGSETWALYGAPTSQQTVDHLYSDARVGIYLLGLCEILQDVPDPVSKKPGDIRKDWLKSYSLRLAAQGITDFAQNKQMCLQKFQGCIDVAIMQKLLQSLRKISATATNTVGAAQIGVPPEPAIRKLLAPEAVCGLHSAQAGQAGLSWAGLLHLHNNDRLAAARSLLQSGEFYGYLQWGKARGQWAAAAPQQAGMLNSPPPPPFRGGLPHLAFSPTAAARVIEELIWFTPWTVQKGLTEVTSHRGGQLLRGSAFDPSLGRNEALCSMRDDVAIQAQQENLLRRGRAPHVVFPIEELAERFPPFEDPRRQLASQMSTIHLQKSLIAAGIRPTYIFKLTRTELVNLAFRFQFLLAPRERLRSLAASMQLEFGDYVTRMNEILAMQRNTLHADDLDAIKQKQRTEDGEDITDVFVDATLPPLDTAALEESLLGQFDDAGSSVTSSMVSPTPTQTTAVDVPATFRALVWDPAEFLAGGTAVGSALSQAEEREHATASEAIAADKAEGRAGPFALAPPALQQATARWLLLVKDQEVREFLKNKEGQVVPRLRWSRTQQAGGPGGPIQEKVVYIYGETNIQKFLAWRRRRAIQKRTRGPGGAAGAAVQVGATGPAKPTTTAKSVKVAAEIETKKQKAAEEAKKAAVKSELEQAAVKLQYGGLPATAVRLNTRQLRVLWEQHKVMEAAGNARTPCIVKFVGSYDMALDEFNQHLGRVVNSLKRPEKKFAWFWDPVKEQEAPKYYEMITHPMWLGKCADKARDKEYTAVGEFISDVQLIHDNCFKYNPEGHWIRPIADELTKTVDQRLQQYTYWLDELESVMAEHKKQRAAANGGKS